MIDGYTRGRCTQRAFAGQRALRGSLVVFRSIYFTRRIADLRRIVFDARAWLTSDICVYLCAAIPTGTQSDIYSFVTHNFVFINSFLMRRFSMPIWIFGCSRAQINCNAFSLTMC